MGDRSNRTWSEVKSDPGLRQMLQRLKDHEMTPEEIDAQRRSWVRGEMMIDHPEMTLEEADAVVRKVAGPPLSEILSTARAEARREALEEAVKAAWPGFERDDAAVSVCAILDLLHGCL